MKILAIETSCDETAAAVIEGNNDSVAVLSNVIASQIDIHKKYGGVVPEVAAREHVLQILPVINEALEKAGIDRKNASQELDSLAATIGPGLITSLMVGVETAKSLAYAWNLPIVAVNHIEGHIYANFINQQSEINFPAMILTVSGGHTTLVLMKNHGKYEIIGETRDDAAGEAFDKAAQLLGLGYPGGTAISREAEKFKIRPSRAPVPSAVEGGSRENLKFENSFPRPMLNKDNFDFSFSGLKTSILYKIKKDSNYKKRIPEYCHEFQQAVIDVLIKKTLKAAEKYNVNTIMLTGGVAANKELRQQMSETIKNEFPNTNFLIPDLKYTTDNAAMIGAAGYFHAIHKEYTPWQKVLVDCNAGL